MTTVTSTSTPAEGAFSDDPWRNPTLRYYHRWSRLYHGFRGVLAGRIRAQHAESVRLNGVWRRFDRDMRDRAVA